MINPIFGFLMGAGHIRVYVGPDDISAYLLHMILDYTATGAGIFRFRWEQTPV